MADEALRVEVHGVRDLQKALKQVDDGAAQELKDGFRAIAERVAGSTRAKVARKSGRASASVKARSSSRGGSIAVGGTAAPHYPFLDWGGSVGRGHKTGVPWSGAIKRDWKGNPAGEGRYLYPTIRDNRDDIVRETDDMLERLAKRAGFTQHGEV